MKDTSAAVVASPEFILDAIRDSHRHQCAFDPEADPTARLTFDTTVAEWRRACDLVGADDLGIAMNDVWGIDVPVEQWRAVMKPANARTLGDVCGLIATHAYGTEIRAAGALGARSAAAGAFLTIRSILIAAGADPVTVRPSLPIADVARHFPLVFVGPISRLAPGRLPTVMIRTPFHSASVTVGAVGLLLAAIGRFVYRPLVEPAMLVGLLGVLATFVTSRMPPKEVRFGNVVTFRDLSEVIAK